jgi:hypothetical protein
MATLNIEIDVPIPVGKMIYVDSVVGTSGGVRGRFDKPFATPTQAKAVALAGDLIHVGPGAYVITGNLAKDGVNWYFEQGATVTMVGDIADQVFSDVSGAMSFSVGGYGTFIQQSIAENFDLIDTVRVVNVSSNIEIHCSAIINDRTGVNAVVRSAVRQTAGTLRITCDRIVGIKTIAAWWDDGDGYIDCPYIAGEQAESGPTIYSTCGETATGKWWINSSNIICEDADNNEAIQLTGHVDTEARIWINAQEVRGELSAILITGAWNYLNFMKVSGAFKALTITGGHNWIDCQKVNGGEIGPDFLISLTPSSGENYIKLHNCSEAGATSALARFSSSGTSFIDVTLGDLRVTSSDIDGVQVANAGAYLRLHSTRIYNTVAATTGSPLAFVGGTGPVDISDVQLYALAGNDGVISNTTSVIRASGCSTDGPLGTGVSAAGDLFYDDGADPSGKVSTGNADGTWSWAAQTGGGAVDSVNGETGAVVLDASDVGADPAGSAASAQTAAIAAAATDATTKANAAQAASQPLDSDLTAIAALTPANDDVIQRKAGSWVNRTMAQLWADLKSLADLVYAALAPPSFITYTGGSVATTSTSFANVHASASLAVPSAGFYEFQFLITYQSAATTTGARFGINGTMANSYLAATCVYTSSFADRNCSPIRDYNTGAPVSSTVAATTDVIAVITGFAQFSGAGTLSLRFATGVGGSAITVTALTGFLRKQN